MNQERWQGIERLYHAALARPVGERAGFLAHACGGDEVLRREVEALLATPATGDGIFAAPALAMAGVGRVLSDPPVLTGHRLGVYELKERIGAGGMGEVYRARDTRLGRDVAIKILPQAFTDDGDRLSRFEREARVLAALNHPNIATIHGIEESDGIRGLVMELVGGDTLAERIAGGLLHGSDALPIARQIADALDAAHEKGIVHRDLKPANIKITASGSVKVLDFGLAKVATGDSADSQAPTATLNRTREGIVAGTAPYMSPEQARGLPVDKQSDIWAFGCVLYEMVAGRSPFARGTMTDTLAAVIHNEPDWDLLPEDVPGLRRLLQRCLEKDLKRRYHDIADIRIEIDDLGISAPVVSAPRDRGRKRSIAWWAAASAAVVSSVVVWGVGRALTVTGSTAAPTVTLDRLTYQSGLTRMPALSPDGRLLAYVSDRSGRGDLDIWVQQTAGGIPLRLTDNAADDISPEFSADGRDIVFRSDRDGGGIYIVPALGGAARLVASNGRGPRFSPDGSRLAYWAGAFRGTVGGSASELFTVTLSGGAPVRVAPDFAVARDPAWSPDGRSLLFIGRPTRDSSPAEFDWWWVPPDGGSPVKTGVLDLPGLRSAEPVPRAWTPAGVLFSDGTNLKLIQLSETTGRPGSLQTLTLGTGNYTDATVTAEGDIMFAALTRMRVIDRVGLTGQGPGTVRLHTDGQAGAWRASATRDGSIIAFEQNIGSEWEIWTKDIRTGAQQLVIRVKAPAQTNATISQDGARIAYTVPRRETTGQGYVIERTGGVARLVCEGCGLHGFLSDNRRVLAEMDDGHALRVYDTVTGRFEDLVTTTDGRLDRPHASADERWLAFRRTIATSGKTFVVPLTPGQPASVERAQQVDEPTTTGRPAGWALEAPILYLLLDTDGFRCLWGQRIDPVSGRLDGQPYPVRHFHGEQMLTAGGVSTSFGNPVTVNGFLYEATAVTGDIWRLRRR